MALPVRRLLNLMHFAVTRNATAEQRKEFDELLADADAATGPAAPRPVASGASVAPVRGRAAVPGTASHGIRPPTWWKGDRAAWRNNIRAAEDIEPMALAQARRREAV